MIPDLLSKRVITYGVPGGGPELARRGCRFKQTIELTISLMHLYDHDNAHAHVLLLIISNN